MKDLGEIKGSQRVLQATMERGHSDLKDIARRIEENQLKIMGQLGQLSDEQKDLYKERVDSQFPSL